VLQQKHLGFAVVVFEMLSLFALQDTEDALMMNLRDSHILNHKENLDWNWVLIATILKVSGLQLQ
jgi:rapamycin-insensitive companion of mTOR